MSVRITFALVVVLGCKNREVAPAAAGSGSGSSGSAVGPAPTGVGPSLPALPDAGAVPPETPFDDEARDDGWAAPIEREIGVRLGKLPGDATVTADCRTARCRLTIEGTAASQLDTVTLVEDRLRGFAHHIILSAPETLDGGRWKAAVYVLF